MYFFIVFEIDTYGLAWLYCTQTSRYIYLRSVIKVYMFLVGNYVNMRIAACANN